MAGSGHLYNTTDTTRRREGVTQLPINACPRRSHFSNALPKKATPAKRKQIPSLILGPIGRLAPEPTPPNAKAGAG